MAVNGHASAAWRSQFITLHQLLHVAIRGAIMRGQTAASLSAQTRVAATTIALLSMDVTTELTAEEGIALLRYFFPEQWEQALAWAQANATQGTE